MVEPVKAHKGRQFTGVRLAWERKPFPELDAVARELDQPKVGRRARLSGTVETMETALTSPAPSPLPPLRGDTRDKAKKLLPRYDLYAVEEAWRSWAKGKEPPGNADAAFLAFCKTYGRNNPL